MEPGSVKFAYCDTDSFMLAMTEETIDECVKCELREEWRRDILPKWFAVMGDKASEKEPGLLKEEARISKGWFIAISPKCYVMATVAPNDLEQKLVAPENEYRCYEILAAANEEFPPAKIEKKSAKGCSKKIPLRWCFCTFFLNNASLKFLRIFVRCVCRQL